MFHQTPIKIVILTQETLDKLKEYVSSIAVREENETEEDFEFRFDRKVKCIAEIIDSLQTKGVKSFQEDIDRCHNALKEINDEKLTQEYNRINTEIKNGLIAVGFGSYANEINF